MSNPIAEIDRKRRARYLSQAVTRDDKAALTALRSEFPKIDGEVAGYKAAYHDPMHKDHQATVNLMADLYQIAGDF